MKFTEKQLKLYAAPISNTEEQKCKNAIGMVRDALKNIGFTDDGKEIKAMVDDTYSFSLEMRSSDKYKKVKLFVQGSYANNTNVRTESDVDVAVVLESTFTTRYREGITDTVYNFSSSDVNVRTFKDDVEEALRAKFGDDVERKNKSIKIHGNTYRVDADGVPAMRHRDYRDDYDYDSENYVGSILIRSDDGEKIINYPEQHIKNGRQKNNDTNTYYKKMVRIIKKMRYIMQEKNYSSASNVSSFGLESLLWNIEDKRFCNTSYGLIFKDILDYLYENIEILKEYKEANGIKPLCEDDKSQKHFQRFIQDLYDFYEYEGD